VAKRKGGKGGGERNSNRRNGKAMKKNPKVNKKTGKSCCGYSIKRTDRLGHDQGHKKVAA
jgi:hypothetical protein